NTRRTETERGRGAAGGPGWAEPCAKGGRRPPAHPMPFAPPPADELRKQSIPVYPAVDAAIRALALAVRCADSPPALLQLPPAAAPIARDDYWAARELMVAAGLPFPPARRGTSARDARQAAPD